MRWWIFNKEKVSHFFESNLKVLLLIFGGVFLLGAGAAVFFHVRGENEKKANETLYEHKNRLELAGKKANGENYKSNDLSRWILFQKKDTVFSDEMKQAALQFEKSLKKYKKTKVSVYFVVELADFYAQSGQREKARSLLELFSGRKHFSTIYQLLRLQLASLYMEDKLCRKALAVLENAVHKSRTGVFDTEVYFKRGLCYEEINQKEKARKSYEAVIAREPESVTATRAKDYILTMRLKEESRKEDSRKPK